jgi:hypothetical protein
MIQDYRAQMGRASREAADGRPGAAVAVLYAAICEHLRCARQDETAARALVAECQARYGVDLSGALDDDPPFP